MPKCNICKTIYESKQRQVLINNEVYWCAFCDRVFKRFNPFPAKYFSPEVNPEVVIERQINRYNNNKSWYRNYGEQYSQ